MQESSNKNLIDVLVVDDEPMMRSLVERILQRDGYRVSCAENGEQALTLIGSGRFSIVISDVKMPGMGGFELLREVKTRFPRVFMIMMTAYGDTYTIKDAMLLGADEYISKPFKSHEISLVVERAYWKMQSESQLSDSLSRSPQ